MRGKKWKRESMAKKIYDFETFYNELDNKPRRISEVRVREMITFLHSKGFRIDAWKRVSFPHWTIQSNQFYWNCKSHIEAFNHIYPYYYEYKQKAYAEYMKKKAEKLRKELKENEGK